VETSPIINETTTGLLYQPRMMDDDECEAIGGMLGRGNCSTLRKPAPVLLCPPHIPHGLIQAETRAATVESQRLGWLGYSTANWRSYCLQLCQQSKASYMHLTGFYQFPCLNSLQQWYSNKTASVAVTL
jgi:hypothetical protein